MDEEILEMFHNTYTTDTDIVLNINKLEKALEEFSLQDKSLILENLYLISQNKDKNNVEKIQELKRMLEKRHESKHSHLPKRVIAKKPISPKLKEYVNDEIKSYQDTIKYIIHLPFDEFLSYCETINSNDTNYLILGLEKEILSYHKIADESYLSHDIETLKQINLEIDELVQKQIFLQKQRDTIVLTPDSIKCNVIFLETASGRIYFLQDILGDDELYTSYAKLIKSLQDDNPYKPKQFNLKIINYIVRELKNITAKIRLFYEKISPDTYIIIGAMTKKDNTGKGYFDTLLK